MTKEITQPSRITGLEHEVRDLRAELALVGDAITAAFKRDYNGGQWKPVLAVVHGRIQKILSQ